MYVYPLPHSTLSRNPKKKKKPAPNKQKNSLQNCIRLYLAFVSKVLMLSVCAAVLLVKIFVRFNHLNKFLCPLLRASSY